MSKLALCCPARAKKATKYYQLLCVGLLLLSSCSSKPAVLYRASETAAGSLRNIAHVPFYGATVAADQQQRMSTAWAGWWSDVYPGRRWLTTQQSIATLAGENALSLWAAAERLFVQTGTFDDSTRKALCAALKVDGIFQGHVFGVQAGSGAGSFLSMPWNVGRGTPSTASVSGTLIDCATGRVVWQSSQDISYNSNYTYSQVVEEAHNALAAKIAP